MQMNCPAEFLTNHSNVFKWHQVDVILQQKAQLMLTNPHDMMFYVNRVSAYLVVFSR